MEIAVNLNGEFLGVYTQNAAGQDICLSPEAYNNMIILLNATN